MKTSVISLTGRIFDGEAKAVHVTTESGDITVLDHHEPILTVLAAESQIRIEALSNGQESFVARNGFLHLNGDNELTILVD